MSREENITVKFNQLEADLIDAVASAFDWSKSDVVRQAILRGIPLLVFHNAPPILDHNHIKIHKIVDFIDKSSSDHKQT